MGRKKGPRFYGTTKSAAHHLAEIQDLLNDFEVHSYHVFRDPDALGFVVETGSGKVPFKLEPNIEGLRARFNEPGVPKPDTSVEATAWAQMRHMVEIMLEIVESGNASLPEVFGGFALTHEGITVGQAIEGGKAQLGPETTLMLEGS